MEGKQNYNISSLASGLNNSELGGWIKVSDRLPEKGKDVFILLKNTKGRIAYMTGAYFDEWSINIDEEESTYFNPDNDGGYKIIAWIYPPLPPKE